MNVNLRTKQTKVSLGWILTRINKRVKVFVINMRGWKFNDFNISDERLNRLNTTNESLLVPEGFRPPPVLLGRI